MDYSLLLVIEEVEGDHILDKKTVEEKKDKVNSDMSRDS
jgi:hypothetical protein